MNPLSSEVLSKYKSTLRIIVREDYRAGSNLEDLEILFTGKFLFEIRDNIRCVTVSPIGVEIQKGSASSQGACMWGKACASSGQQLTFRNRNFSCSGGRPPLWRNIPFPSILKIPFANNFFLAVTCSCIHNWILDIILYSLSLHVLTYLVYYLH